MLHGFYLDPAKIGLNTSSNPTAPFSVAANPYKPDGTSIGLVAKNGMVREIKPEGLPALICYRDGSVEMKDNFNVHTIANAKFIFSGSAWLRRDGKDVTDPSPLVTQLAHKVPRIGFGIDKNNRLLVLANRCTLAELRYAFRFFEAEYAMCGAFGGEVYLNYKEDVKFMGTSIPITTLEAVDVRHITRPIVVIDPYGGGSQFGQSCRDVHEKDFALRGAGLIQTELMKDFVGTFLVTRTGDYTMSVATRVEEVNAVEPDLLVGVSLKGGKEFGGFETMLRMIATDVEHQLQDMLVHRVGGFLERFGMSPSRVSKGNPQRLMETSCPAVVIRYGNVEHPLDYPLLSDRNLMREASKITSEVIADFLGLEKLLTTQQEEPSKLFRVYVGGFRTRRYAEHLQEQLKRQGFYDSQIRYD